MSLHHGHALKQAAKSRIEIWRERQGFYHGSGKALGSFTHLLLRRRTENLALRLQESRNLFRDVFRQFEFTPPGEVSRERGEPRPRSNDAVDDEEHLPVFFN